MSKYPEPGILSVGLSLGGIVLNWVDYLLIVILAVTAWGGLMRGLVRSVLGLASLALGVVLALKYYAPFGQYVDERLGLTSALATYYVHKFPMSKPVAGFPVVTGGEGEWPLPASFEELISSFDLFLAGEVSVFGQGFPDTLATATVNAAAFLLVFLITAHIAGRLLSVVPRLPLLMPLDRAGGFCLGLAKGFVLGALAVGALKLASLSSVFMGPNVVSEGLVQSQVAPSYMRFIDYLWAFVMPVAK